MKLFTSLSHVLNANVVRCGSHILPGEPQPVVFSVHGAIAEHYKVEPAKLKESHASTIDYVISATAG